jgi:hypothetical protein
MRFLARALGFGDDGEAFREFGIELTGLEGFVVRDNGRLEILGIEG